MLAETGGQSCGRRILVAVDAEDELVRALREGGHRITRPRVTVWRVLCAADRHLTVEQIAERTWEQEPGVNLASVYRSLALFDELGLARESRLPDEEAGRWEVAHPDEHFHVMCSSCGQVEHHVGDLVVGIRAHLSSGHGFEAATVDVTVTGTCQACAVANAYQDA